jgi:hypothetical protein
MVIEHVDEAPFGVSQNFRAISPNLRPLSAAMM